MKFKKLLSFIIVLAMLTSMLVTMTTVSALSITEQAYWEVESGKNEPAIEGGKMKLVAGDSAMIVLSKVPGIGTFNASSTYTIEFDATVTEATNDNRILYVAQGAYYNQIETHRGKIRTGDANGGAKWTNINTVNQNWHYKLEIRNKTITSTVTDDSGNVISTGSRTNDAYAVLEKHSLRCENGAVTVDNVKVSKDGTVLLTDTFEIPEAEKPIYEVPSITEQAYWEVESGKNEPAIEGGKMKLVAGESAMLVLSNVPNIGLFKESNAYTIEFDATVTSATSNSDNALYIGTNAWYNQIQVFMGKLRAGDTWNESISTVNQDWHYKIELANGKVTSTITDSDGNVVLTGYRTSGYSDGLAKYSLRCVNGAVTVDNVKVSKNGNALLIDGFEVPEAEKPIYEIPSITEHSFWEVESGKNAPAIEGGKMKLVSGESAMLVLSNVPNIGTFNTSNTYTVEFDATVTEATSNSDNTLYVGTNGYYNQIQVFMGKLRAGDTWNESISTVNQDWHYKIELANGKVTSTITDSDGNVVLTGYRTNGYSDGLAKYSLRCVNGAITVDNVTVSKNGNALLIDEFKEKNVIYTTANGWTLLTNSTTGKKPTEQEDGTLKLEGKSHAQYKPALDSTKKYEITYDITGLATGGGQWDQDFRVKLISGGNAVDPIITHREAGYWMNDVTGAITSNSGATATNKLVIDMETGEWESYADGVLCMSGTIASTTDLTFEFYSWTANEPSIGNVQVKEVPKNVIYTTENGWTLLINSETGKKPTEQEDGTLKLEGKAHAQFKPALDSTKKYEITYDVTGLATGGSIWDQDFRVKLISGDNSVDPIITHREAGKWVNDNGAITTSESGVSSTNKLVINMETGEWESYADNILCMSGTIASTNDLTFEFYGWTANEPSIGNVQVREVPKNVIYTAENGWTLPVSESGAKALEKQDGSLQLNNNAIFKPALANDKVYEITYDITGLLTGGGQWDQDFRVKMSSGENVVDPIASHREAGCWADDATGAAMVTSGDTATNKIIIDMTTGKWEAYADGVLCMSGAIASTDDLTFEFYSWTANKPSIANVQVKETIPNVIYTLENGWTLSGASDELEDGRLMLDNSGATFKPVLEAGRKYSIKYDVSGIETGSDAWAYQFRVEMSAGGTQVDGILSYRMGGVWEARGIAVALATNGTNEIIIDTKTGKWEAYALGSLSNYGTLENLDDFALKFYHWSSDSATVPHPYISNVTVEEIVFDGTYYQQNFDGIQADFDSWKTATTGTVMETQPLQVWRGSFVTTGEDKHLMSSAMDIYPLVVTPGTDKYEFNFDFKPYAATDPNGSNWESVVMQWNLGSTNSDSWHDMKIGTSQGANVSGTVTIDRLWIFGKEMVIDPNEWVNVNLMYDCKGGEINAKITQGSTVVTASAGFVREASAPKVTFEGIKRNEVEYAGVYLDNIEIKAVGDDVAPVLNADSIKLYAGTVEQPALNASAFTNKIDVIFGQVMWPEDMSMEKIYVVDTSGNKITGEGIVGSYDDGVYTITYNNGLKGGQTYTVRVENVRNIEGVYTLEVYEKNFYVASGVYAELVSITQDGNVIENAANLSTGNAKINVNYSNTEDEAPVLHIVVAYYKDGDLVLADYFDKTADVNVASIKYELDYEVKTVAEGYDEVQVMVWDGFDTMRPLSAPIDL